MRDIVVQLAERLDRAERERREIDPLTGSYPDLTVAEAYAIQRRLVALREERGARIIGYKAGLTSEAKQESMGVHEPIYGHLCSDMVLAPGASLVVGELIHARAEPEVAFILGSDLQGPGVTADDVLAAAEGVLPALEIIDSRYRAFRFTLADVIADNASGARVVLGAEQAEASALDLARVQVTFQKNGAVLDVGLGSAVLGHPAKAIAWLANMLAEARLHLRAGDLVLPGALCDAHPLAPGDEILARFVGLGEVHLVCS